MSTAEYTKADGLRYIEIDGNEYRTDRLAVFYVTGKWPVGKVEHIDGDENNDAWSNLRFELPKPN